MYFFIRRLGPVQEESNDIVVSVKAAVELVTTTLAPLSVVASSAAFSTLVSNSIGPGVTNSSVVQNASLVSN